MNETYVALIAFADSILGISSLGVSKEGEPLRFLHVGETLKISGSEFPTIFMFHSGLSCDRETIDIEIFLIGNKMVRR